MNCGNCTMEIIGKPCADKDKKKICFSCWLWSTGATTEFITCPKCYGIGQHTKGFTAPKLVKCKICKGSGKITRANLDGYAIPVATNLPATENAECPF